MHDKYYSDLGYEFTDNYISSESCTWGMLCHIAGLAGSFVLPTVGHIVGPLIFWLLKKDTDRFVDDQGREALNFQISMTIYALVLGVGAFFAALACAILVGIPFLFAIIALAGVMYIAEIVLVIIAAIESYRGVRYRYPMIIRFL